MLFNSQIVRAVPLTEATNAINDQFHALLGNNVWEKLHSDRHSVAERFPLHERSFCVDPPDPGTDFEKEPDMNCAPAPTYLANSTLETYSQGEIPQASSSCMACHGNAISYSTPAQRQGRKESGRRQRNGKRRQMFINQSDFTFMLEKAR